MTDRDHQTGAGDGTVATAKSVGVHTRSGLVGKAAAVIMALLLGPCISVPVAAQTGEQDQPARPAAKKAKASKAAKPRTPPSSKTGDAPTADKTPPKQVKNLDPAKLDLPKLGATEAMQVDPSKLDPKSANSWVVLGLVEGHGGNLAGAKESFERAMALGERRNKAGAAAAALLLGKVHLIGLSFVRTDARGAASFGGTPSKDTTDLMSRQFESAKTSFEKAVALYQAVGNKDGMAAGYAQLGELYRTTTDYEEAQAEIGKALAINKALQRKKAMAANYRALAETHRYDLDQAEVLLKQAVALHEALELKEELARDYEKLGAVNKSRGEPFEAERLYKQALALTPREHQGSLLRALERLYRDREDPGQAEEMKEQAAAVDKERGAGGRLVFSSGMGLFQSSSASKQQTEALENVVPLEKKLGHWVGLATSYTLLGMHYSVRAENDEDRRADLQGRAEAMLREALALNRTLGREQAMAYIYRELAETVDRRSNLPEVEETLKDAQALYKKLGNEGELGSLYASLGYGRSRRGDQTQACDYWRKGAMAYPDEKRLVDALNHNKCATTP
jgi:tetratricopeptide (TPR) repeat protein